MQWPICSCQKVPAGQSYGPGGATTDKQVVASGTLSGKNFSAVIPGSTDAAIRHGVQVRMLVQMDQDTFTNSGNYYKFAIDDSVTLPGGFAVTTAGFYDVTVGWNAIPDTDFLQYDIYYSTVNPVTSADPSVTVTSRTQTSVQIPNLTLNATYYFAIQSRDNKGNVSGLSPQITQATKQGTNVSVSNASDGNSSITTFDGSATLTDNSITVTFTLDKTPPNSSSVQVWFDVGNNPDGAGGINSEDRQVFGSGSGRQWQVVIPGNDPELVDQAVVKFVFVIDGQIIQLQGVPYRFKLLKGITEAPGNLAITDTSGRSSSARAIPLRLAKMALAATYSSR